MIKNNSISIGIVSFIIDLADAKKSIINTKIVESIINSYKYLDIIIFPGFSLYNIKELNYLNNVIDNNYSLIILEVWKDFYKKVRHKGYYFQNGKLIDRQIVQYFATSKDINGNSNLMVDFLKHFDKCRNIKFKNKIIRWLICGELNVLKNEQKKDNKTKFRFDNTYELNEYFNQIYNNTDIFINPTHTQMGNQGKMKKRRDFLSRNRKLYISTSNFDLQSYLKKRSIYNINYKKKLNQKSMQYCVYNMREIQGNVLELSKFHILKIYEIIDFF